MAVSVNRLFTVTGRFDLDDFSYTDRGTLSPSFVTERPLATFDWHYGQLLNYNGLTRAALLVWPLLTAAWLFALAGRPAWGKPADPP